MTEMSSVVLIFRLCLIDLLSAIASPSIAWWYCSPPSVSPAPWQLGPLQQGRLANDRGPAQIARLEDHTRDGSLPILLEAKDPDIDQPGKVQDTLVCVTMTNMQLLALAGVS